MNAKRFMLELAYRGTNYAGWQRQPNVLSVEEVVDSALSLMLGRPIKLVGCGRTDTGVHASAYSAHFEYDGSFPPALLQRLNRYLPDDIAVHRLYELPAEVHARFSATGRAYVYRASPLKDPFRPHTVATFPKMQDLNRDAMQASVALLKEYQEFATFCKTNADNYTNRCDLRRAEWVFGEEEWEFHIEADRFLRGMVRLIVGMSVQVGRGKLGLEQVREALDAQHRLPKPLSAPAAGLYLCKVEYVRNNWVLLTSA